jgi:hypothetical protein
MLPKGDEITPAEKASPPSRTDSLLFSTFGIPLSFLMVPLRWIGRKLTSASSWLIRKILFKAVKTLILLFLLQGTNLLRQIQGLISNPLEDLFMKKHYVDVTRIEKLDGFSQALANTSVVGDQAADGNSSGMPDVGPPFS